MADATDRYIGSLLGLGLADALGAPYEGWSTEIQPSKPMRMTRRGTMLYTDDTDMAIGSATSIVKCGGLSVDHMAQVWAKRADAGRGYGGGAIRCLNHIKRGMPWREASYSVYRDGSYGNGAAMRVAPIALLYSKQIDLLDEAVRLASSFTHAHPLGIQGAQIIARAIVKALVAEKPEDVLSSAIELKVDLPHRQRLRVAGKMYFQPLDHREVASVLGNGIAAHESVSTALLTACWFLDKPFADMMGFILSVGGDVDTIGAMAGGIWGAYRGCRALPDPPLCDLEDMDLLASYGKAIAGMTLK